MARSFSTITVSKSALLYNAEILKSLLPKKCKLCCVVKANAYGHNARFVVKTLAGLSDFFAVASNAEALEILPYLNPLKPILVLGALGNYQLKRCLCSDIHFTVSSYAELQTLLIQAKKLGKTINIHIKINTGMNRFGCSSQGEFIYMLKTVQAEPLLNLAGVYTHFGSSDKPDKKRTLAQANVFKEYLKLIPSAFTPIIHAANTNTLISFPELTFDMVRTGIGLYGYANAPNVPLKPALSLTTRISHILNNLEGSYISYGEESGTAAITRAGVLPIGYADGIPRLLSNKGHFIIDGQKTDILGNVCMDSCIVNLSYIKGAKTGMTATFIGSNNAHSQTANDIAILSNTITYEILTNLNHKRLHFVAGK